MDYWTVKQVADKLQVTPLTVRRWLNSGQLQGLQLGKRAGWRIPKDELARFLATRERAESGQGAE